MRRRNFKTESRNFSDNFEHFDEFSREFESPESPVFFVSNNRRRNRNVEHVAIEEMNTATCQQLANIIGGEVITATPVCVVQRLRNINATILGRQTRSPLALPFALSFEDNRNGRTLNLGETVILQEEINPFMTELRRRGITITAVHNHWLFENPRLMYMHWENVGDPVRFATNSIEAARQVGIF